MAIKINKHYIKLLAVFLLTGIALLGVAFFSGTLSVQAGNPSTIVPMNDETQACREACGLGEGKPSGDFFGYDSANECLNNCFAAKGIGNVSGSCDPNLADNCCNAFAAPGQDPDCDTGIEFGQCFNSSSDFASCTEIGGIFINDETCSPFTHHTFSNNCIDDFFTTADCSSIDGTVESTNQCSSGQGCFIDESPSGRCLENKCPRQGDTVEYLTVNSTTGDATFKNLRDNRNYSCTLLGSQPGFDCKTVTAGTVVDLISLGILGDDLACHTHFNIGTDNVPNLSLQECTYSCSIQP